MYEEIECEGISTDADWFAKVIHFDVKELLLVLVTFHSTFVSPESNLPMNVSAKFSESS
jgi:hypothetical protein